MKKGFTLIELLVVVAIVAILSAVVLANLNDARKKGRDARRLSDLRQIQNALEMYFDDNGRYPPRDYAYETSASCGGNANWCSLITDLAPYISSIPGDPLNTRIDPYRYYYDSDPGDNNQTYGFMIAFESSSNYSKAINDGGYYNSAGAYYEVGQQPAYCMSKYSLPDGPGGTARHWWATSTDVCLGGN